MANTTAVAAQQIRTANGAQSSQALQIQNYATSVKEQPKVDFSGFKKLSRYQDDINAGLDTAQGHADSYLFQIQPEIIKNIGNIANYYSLHQSVATTLQKGTTKDDWIDALSALRDTSAGYQNDAKNVLVSLQNLHNGLTSDAAAFSRVVYELNTAVAGDDGVLKSLDVELGSIQGKIDGAIAGAVVSGLAVGGGIFITAVGAVTDFVTAGTSTPLVVAGVALVLVGVGGETASAIALMNLNDEKATIINNKVHLNAEVKLAQGMSSGYKSLGDQVKAAVNASSQMENAWSFLGDDLGNLIKDLNKGAQSTETLRTIFLSAANQEVSSVTRDIQTIKTQMAGVRSIVASPGQTVGEAIVAAAKNAA